MPNLNKLKDSEKLGNLYSALSVSALIVLSICFTIFYIAKSCNDYVKRNSNSHNITSSPDLQETISFNVVNYAKPSDLIKIDRKNEKETKNVKPAKKVSNKPKPKIVISSVVNNTNPSTYKRSRDCSLPKANTNNCTSQAKIYNPKVIWVKKTNNLTQIGNTTPPPLNSITIKVPSKVPPSLNAASNNSSQGIVKVKCPTASGGYAYSNNANSGYFLN
jgi:type II secretory pathway component PulC